MDLSIDNAYIFDEKGKYLRFYKCPVTKLYQLDISMLMSCGIMLLAIEGQENKFSALDCTQTKALRRLQHMLAYPSDYNLFNTIENNVIGNNAYSRWDVVNAQIFGPSIPGLNGTTVKLKNKLPREDELIDILPTIASRYKDVTLSIDVIQLNKIIFLV